jgi:hypothetical protein
MTRTLWELLREHKIDLTTAQHICNDAMINGVSVPCETVDADDYEKRIREKVFNANILTNGEWVYLVGLFHYAREASDEAATARDKADYKIGWWLSGALEDPAVCAEMKADINAWFEAHQPGLVMPDVAQRTRNTVDAYSYCKGLETAVAVCEKPCKPWNGDNIEPAAPVHASILRGLIDGYSI